MPNPFIDHRDRWLLHSGIDYLGQIVKMWFLGNQALRTT